MKKIAVTLLFSIVSSSAALAQAPATVSLPADIERVLKDYEKAWIANDLAALAKLFTVDGMALPSGQVPARGDEQIRKAYARGTGSPINLRAFAYGASGDMAYVLGGFGSTGKPEFGKFVLVLRKVDGRWMIAADMDNSNAPRRAAAPAAPAAAPASTPQ